MSVLAPSVSAVIPCRNASPFVARAVRSVLDQTLPPKQIICVDDGSTDDTAEVLEQLRLESGGFIDLVRRPPLGAGAARNTGLDRATGEFIQFLDADDILLPAKLERQMPLIIGGPHDVVAGAYLKRPVTGPESYCGPRYLSPWANLIAGGLGVTSSNLWRREAALRAGGWSEKQESSQEYELLFRMMKQSASTVLCHEPLTEKIERPEGITSVTGKPSRRRERNILNYISLRRAMADHLEARGLLSDTLRSVYLERVHASLKSLYPYDPERALHIHREVVPEGYCLQTSDGPGVPALEDLQSARHSVISRLEPRGR